MCITYIIGRRSYLSKNLKKEIKNSKIISVREILNNQSDILKDKKINIIYNHSYPLAKINLCKDYGKIINENIVLLKSLFDFFLKKKIIIKKFIFSSSSAVYGLEKNFKNFDINDNNRRLYGVSKFLSEIFFLSQKKKFNYELIIARIFNIFGKKEKISIISKIIEFKKKNKKIKNFTNQNSFRDFIHIYDVVKIYKIFLSKKSISGQYDIGTSKSVNIRNLINRYFNKKQQINYKNANFSEVKFSKANIKNLQKISGKLSFINVNKFIKESLSKS